MDQLAIDGNGTNRVFYFAIGSTNLIAGLTITNGSARRAVDKRFGGGIFNDRAVLMVSNVTLIRNSADRRGGIYNSRVLKKGFSSNKTCKKPNEIEGRFFRT